MIKLGKKVTRKRVTLRQSCNMTHEELKTYIEAGKESRHLEYKL